MGEAATRLDRVKLSDVRRGQYEGLREAIALDERTPDFGPRRTHLTAGAVAVDVAAPGVPTDVPGLLARIAYILATSNINVASAKINTLGERAEDVFLLDGARLHDEAALLRLETALYEQLRLA